MNTVLFITIATGNYYSKFIPDLYESMVKYFNFDFKLLCLTDDTNTDNNIIKKHIKHAKWPYSTLMRYHHILHYVEDIKKYDFIFYIDSDMKICDYISYSDIVSSRVGILHPGFYHSVRSEFTYETNKKSKAYIKSNEGIHYYQGCLHGGSRETFLDMCNTIKNNIDEDLKRNIIALWHDESHLNRYFIDNPPSLSLSPDFAVPENWIGVKKEWIQESDCWNILYETTTPKIIHLEKNHKEIRE
jgi:histo-blood group ABO system transferase